MELTREKARELNEIAEFSLLRGTAFDISAYSNPKGMDYDYAKHLVSLGKYINNKYGHEWVRFNQPTTVMKMTDTKEFLKSGGYLSLYKKEQPKWSDAHPLADKFRTGAITALFSLIVGIILWLLANQKQAQINMQVQNKLDSLTRAIDSLPKR